MLLVMLLTSRSLLFSLEVEAEGSTHNFDVFPLKMFEFYHKTATANTQVWTGNSDSIPRAIAEPLEAAVKRWLLQQEQKPNLNFKFFFYLCVEAVSEFLISYFQTESQRLNMPIFSGFVKHDLLWFFFLDCYGDFDPNKLVRNSSTHKTIKTTTIQFHIQTDNNRCDILQKLNLALQCHPLKKQICLLDR